MMVKSAIASDGLTAENKILLAEVENLIRHFMLRHFEIIDHLPDIMASKCGAGFATNDPRQYKTMRSKTLELTNTSS